MTSLETAELGWRHWLTWAAMWGMLAAVGYTLANIFLRSASGVDPFLVTAVKTAPTSLLAIPWLLLLRQRRLPLLPSAGDVRWLFAAALVGQFGGNVAFQWSLGVIGMALAVPLNMGCLIFSSALLGRNVLGEQAGWQNFLALVFVAISIAVLMCGAEAAEDSVAGSTAPGEIHGPLRIAAGVLAACLAGVSYAVLGAAIRNCVARGTPEPVSMLIVSGTGAVVIGLLACARLGSQIASVPASAWLEMGSAGVWNALAFLALTKCLKTAPLYYTNALNATQIAMAALAGVLFFREAATLPLLTGVGLTMAGLLLIRNR